MWFYGKHHHALIVSVSPHEILVLLKFLYCKRPIHDNSSKKNISMLNSALVTAANFKIKDS